MPRGRRGKKSDSVLFKSAEWIGWALGGLEREIEETRERLKVLTEQAADAAEPGRCGGAVAASPRRLPQRGQESQRGRRVAAACPPRDGKRISEMMKKRWHEAKKKNRNRL